MKIELTEDQIDGVVYGALMTLEENNPTDRKLHKAIKRVLSVQFSYETGLLADRQYENEPYENESRREIPQMGRLVQRPANDKISSVAAALSNYDYDHRVVAKTTKKTKGDK